MDCVNAQRKRVHFSECPMSDFENSETILKNLTLTISLAYGRTAVLVGLKSGRCESTLGIAKS